MQLSIERGKIVIAAIYGSPRKNGNTDILMDKFIQPLQEAGEDVVKFKLRDKTLKPCIACGGCNETGQCVFKDDIWDIYSELNSAKAIVISSPIYFATVCAQLKMFIDRGQAFWANKYLLGNENFTNIKHGYFICAGAIDTNLYFENARLVIKTYLQTLDIDYGGDIFFSGVDEKGEILQKEGAVEEAVTEGEKVLDML